ncbi:MAG TPA: alpha/beta hydrolase domain-containing protein [Bryobacteraceae bacterium]|nr:alpha/beta hydrolase domain-containing protein [Bryobacteraceae bacterium]
MRSLRLMLFIVIANLFIVGVTVHADPTVPPLPNTAEPPFGNGVSFRQNALLDVSGGSLSLAAFGYVEEEFIVSGKTNLYQYDPSGAVALKTAGVPYATRIIVRRPANPRRFSGNVYVEGGPGADGMPWAADYIFAHGDVWVSIFTHGLRMFPQTVLQTFDPVRYAQINFPDFGQNWDIMSQVGRLLKTQVPANPLLGYNVKRIYANGWSGGASIWWFYINDGFHQQVRMPDGGPIYDGYLVGEPSGYSPINQDTFPAPIPPGDPRLTVVLPRDVPAIVLHSRLQEVARRRADSDDPNDRYRVYEIAGATHANLRVSRAYRQPEAAFHVGGPFACVNEISRFPFHYYFQSTLARLHAWAAHGVKPPPSQRLALNPDGTVILDEHGNDVGGIRSTQLDVPTARYLANAAGPGGHALCNGENALGAQARFSPEKLDALYKNRGGYVFRVFQRAHQLEREGWLLPADAREVLREATHFHGF